jgi:hypothetical protein
MRPLVDIQEAARLVSLSPYTIRAVAITLAKTEEGRAK